MCHALPCFAGAASKSERRRSMSPSIHEQPVDRPAASSEAGTWPPMVSTQRDTGGSHEKRGHVQRWALSAAQSILARGRLPWKAEQILKLFGRNHIDVKTVCEIGCGAGEILLQLYEKMPVATTFDGYEISPQAYAMTLPGRRDRINFHLTGTSACGGAECRSGGRASAIYAIWSARSLTRPICS